MPRLVELNGVVANCLAARQLHLGREPKAPKSQKSETVIPIIIYVFWV